MRTSVTATWLALLGFGVASCTQGANAPQPPKTTQRTAQNQARCAAEVPGTAVSLSQTGNELEVAYRTRFPQQVDNLRPYAFQQGQTVRGRASGGGLTAPEQRLPPVIVRERPLPDGLALTYSVRDPEDFEIVRTMLSADVERQNRGHCGIVRPGSVGMDPVPAASATWESDPVPQAPDREWKLSITAVRLSEPLARQCRIPKERRLEVFDAADMKLDGYPVLTALVKCLQASGDDRPLRLLGRANPGTPTDFESIMGRSRAAAVASFLQQMGFKVEAVDHAGQLEQTAADDSGWSWERRVDIE